MTEVILNPGETIYVPSSVGHAVLNLDAETLALTENPMVITSAIEELPLFHGNGYISFLQKILLLLSLSRHYRWIPVDWMSHGAGERIWRNLMNRRDLWTPDERKYARAMLEQVREHRESRRKERASRKQERD